MPRLARLLLLAAACVAGPAWADEAQPRGGEPAVQHRVIEDDGVRIEELRVRGQVQRIVVQSKIGHARPYQIVPETSARDPSQDKRSSGQRVWSVLSF